MLIYGYSPFEAIYAYNTKNGLYEIKQLKPLLHQYTWILADRSGNFCGFEQRMPHFEPRWQKTVEKAVNDLRDSMKDKKQADTFDTANFVRNRLVDMLKEMGVIDEERCKQ